MHRVLRLFGWAADAAEARTAGEECPSSAEPSSSNLRGSELANADDQAAAAEVPAAADPVAAGARTRVLRASRDGDADVRLTFDLPYVSAAAEGGASVPDHHRLNVYAPLHSSPAAAAAAAGAAGLPVVVHVHGGGWQRGSRSKRFYGAPYMGLGYARAGFVCVVPSYRLYTRHPNHVDDVARAVLWARAHAAAFGGDPTRLFLSGHSAGAHLVALLATDPRHLAAAAGDPTLTPAAVIRGVVAISGLYYLPSPFHRDGEPPARSWQNAFFQKLYVAKAFGAAADAQHDASPAHHVAQLAERPAAARPPPFLVVNAASDLGLEHDGARFAQLLQAAGAPVQRLVVPDRWHGDVTRCPETLAAAVAFVTCHAAPQAEIEI